MKFLNALLALASMGLVSAFPMDVTYELQYNNPSGDLASVSCSDGATGMMTRGFSTFGSIPRFPYIASSSLVSGWDSGNCGQCISITYQGKTIHATVIDSMPSGIDLSLGAMNDLTNGQAQMLGRVSADIQQVES